MAQISPASAKFLVGLAEAGKGTAEAIADTFAQGGAEALADLLHPKEST
jgi:hypothetical protein